jgi:conjugal transfer ATP-binding protein TraC
MLKQSAAALKKLSSGDGAQIPPELAEWLATVHTVPGKYSEVFVTTAIGQGIGRFIVDPFTALLYSTHPQDQVDVQKYVSQGMEVTDAINAVLEERARLSL